MNKHKHSIQSATSHAATENDSVEISDPDRLTDSPLVSVLMVTYNHADYLAEAIEGVIAQQCDFPFELLVGEDASSDETLKIALDCQRRHPDIVRVIYADKNVGAYANIRRILSRARGEYIAYCEGDDYWCSPHKLSNQVELIKDNADVGIVHTDWVRSRNEAGRWNVAWRRTMHRRVRRKLLEGDIFRTFHYPKILRTCTVLLRRSIVLECIGSVLGRKKYGFGDVVLAAYTTSRWSVAYLPEVTAVYRESPNSVLRSGIRARLTFLKSSLTFDADARRYFSDRNDYPKSYRWEVSVGLLLWAVRARDADSVKFALTDIWMHFSIVEFVVAGWQTMMMRRPTLHLQRRRDASRAHALTNESPSR